ncbi:type VI secretion system baseplate subunit TssK [Salinisphaera sp. C84B14]|uniref:type VI secretion system baseplate subunit TssK n=1 Tax=Salinisphaera sp. C84B14 TaxID=1304155 RepID=UPI00334105AC
MNGNRRVLWGEGLFLRPQHFQRQDAFHDGRMREVMADLHPYAWGIRASRVDVGALRNGVFRLESLSAIFPDGETVNAPDSDPLPEAIGLDALPDNTSSVVIHAAIPRFKNHGGNLGADGNGLSRYVKTTAQTADLFTDASEAEIAFLGKSVRLLTDDKPRDEFICLPIARVERASTGGFELDKSFMPPCLNIEASPLLQQQLRSLLDALQAKVEALYGHHREPSKHVIEFRSGDIASFWLLHTASTSFARLSHFLHHPGLYPERLYQQMLELAGSLMTFSKVYTLNDLPAYSHDDPGPCFDALMRINRELLEAVISERYFKIALTEQRPSYYLGQLASDRIDERTELYLSVGADMPATELIDVVPVRFKVGAPDDVEKCVLSALPGVKLVHTPQAPAAVPVRSGQYYFALQAQGPLYERMLKAGSVMIYVPNGVSDLKLELIAVTP